MICFEGVFSRLWHIEVVSMGMIGPIRGPIRMIYKVITKNGCFKSTVCLFVQATCFDHDFGDLNNKN